MVFIRRVFFTWARSFQRCWLARRFLVGFLGRFFRWVGVFRGLWFGWFLNGTGPRLFRPGLCWQWKGLGLFVVCHSRDWAKGCRPLRAHTWFFNWRWHGGSRGFFP